MEKGGENFGTTADTASSREYCIDRSGDRTKKRSEYRTELRKEYMI